MPPLAEYAIGTAARRHFEALDDHALARLDEISRLLNLQQDRPIIAEGDPATNLYSLQEGIANVFKLLPDGRRQITGFLYPGNFLGVTFNLDAAYGYSAETVTPCSLRVWPRAKLEKLFDEEPGLRRVFLAEMADELTVAQDRMLMLARRSAEERVSSFLLSMARRQSAAGGERVESVEIPMRWADIADYLGITAETVSRTLSALRDRGIICTGTRGAIAILDWPELEAIEVGVKVKNEEIYR